MKILATNRIANHNYFILQTFEAGIVLEGCEVKSLRAGKADLKEAFVLVTSAGELVLKNMYVAPYEKAGIVKLKDRRDRKLLMHKQEITRLKQKVQQKGFALVPLKVYLKDQHVKVEIGLAKGKHTYDKKESLKEKDLEREARRELKG